MTQMDALLAYCRILTFRRICNLIRCRWNYRWSRNGKIRVSHYPVFLSVEPADWCMLHCPQCPVGIRRTDKPHHLLSASLLHKVLAECSGYAHTMLFYFQGEPLLNKQLPALIRQAVQDNLYTIVSTNAQLLDAEMAEQLVCSGLNKIIVSIDGFTQSSYEVYRVGGNLQKALEGLKHINVAKRKYKSQVVIELQCLYLKSNEQEWDWIRKNYRQLGATKLSMKTAQFYDFEEGNQLMPNDNRRSRYKRDTEGRWYRKKTLRNRCYRLWSGCVIDAQGNVLPCCFDKNREHSFGNINNESFRNIWTGKKAVLFRKKLISARIDMAICRNCTE